MLGQERTQEARVTGLLPKRARHHALLFPFAVMGNDLDLTKAGERLAKLLVLFKKNLSVHDAMPYPRLRLQSSRVGLATRVRAPYGPRS
jgi:hypothetical protein